MTSRISDSAWVALAAWACVVGLIIVYGHQNTEIEKLKRENACLRAPHGESSVQATKVNGVWKMSDSTRTGC